MEISKLNKSSEMLEEEKFWKIVEISLENFENEEKQTDKLISEISKLSMKDMIGFNLRTAKLSNQIYNSEMWCAAYIMNGGCSDDGFEYFKSWVISKGKEVYYKVQKNPDALIEYATLEMDEYEFEQFNYVAFDAYNKMTGEQLYDYIDHREFREKEQINTQIEFNWREENPDTMKSICPQLFDKFFAPLLD